jgi:dethiobiotin synthetase
MSRGFFITGTDTGVGKTVIAAAMIKAIGLIGLKAGGMKPIETGCLREEGALTPSDGLFIKKFADMKDALGRVSPCCLEKPLAPLPASKIDGFTVDLGVIKEAFRELSEEYEAVVVEGIGGLLVPIRKDYFVIDLARDFALPIIVVSRPGLGTLNHTLLSVNYAIKEGLDVAGIIINYRRPPEGTLAEATNPDIIRLISGVPLFGVFPYLENIANTTVEKAVLKNLDLEKIKRYLF